MTLKKKETLLKKIPTLLGKGTFGQRYNHFVNRLAALNNKPKNCPYPTMIQVEVTNRCNLACVFCSRAVSEMTLGDLDSAVMDQVVEISSHAQETALFGYGEPLISKAFYSLLPRLQSAAIGFFTNGLILNQQVLGKILGLTQRPLKYIVFSVDGATPATYEALRAGSNFNKVWKNLENVVLTREKHNLKNPDVNIEFVAMANNVKELPALVRMADESGVGLLKVSHLVVWDARLRDQSLYYHQDLLRKSFSEAAREAEGRRVELALPKLFNSPRPSQEHALPPCRYPWHYAMISYEGDVRACCFAPEFTFGNLKDEPFSKIWNNRPYYKLRSTVNTPKCPLPCTYCEERYRFLPSLDDEKTYIKLLPRKK